MTTYAKLIRVYIQQKEAGVYVASSFDLKGLLVVGKDMDRVMSEVPRAIADLYRAAGTPRVAVPIETSPDIEPKRSLWAAIPVDVVRQALAKA